MNQFHLKTQRAFTLLEIIIAMAIASLIGVGALTLLDSATKTHTGIQQRGERYNKIERALLFISNDIQQLAARDFRDEFGDKQNVITSSNSGNRSYLSLTRLGRRNPAGLARSNLEKLVYQVDEENLQRVSFIYPDGMSFDRGLKRTLLNDVEKMEVLFFDGESWGNIWPINKQKKSRVDLPVAIKISLTLNDLGLIERFFVISDLREKSNATSKTNKQTKK